MGVSCVYEGVVLTLVMGKTPRDRGRRKGEARRRGRRMQTVGTEVGQIISSTEKGGREGRSERALHVYTQTEKFLEPREGRQGRSKESVYRKEENETKWDMEREGKEGPYSSSSACLNRHSFSFNQAVTHPALPLFMLSNKTFGSFFLHPLSIVFLFCLPPSLRPSLPPSFPLPSLSPPLLPPRT